MAHLVPAQYLLIGSKQDYIVYQPPACPQHGLFENSWGLVGRGINEATILFSIILRILLQTLLSSDC